MKAPGDAQRVGPGRRAAKGGSIPVSGAASFKPQASPSGFVLTDLSPSRASLAPTGALCRTPNLRTTMNPVGASLLAMNDNAVYAGSTLSSTRFTANSANMMTCWIANAV
jgi:hypothetical protein